MSSEWFREVCYSCPFAAEQRISDITLGDFWNAEELPERFGKNRRVSVVIINSEKGEALFNEIKSVLNFTASSWETAKEGNSNLYKPTANVGRIRHYGKYMDAPDFFEDLSGTGKNITKFVFNQLPLNTRRTIKKWGKKIKHIGKG